MQTSQELRTGDQGDSYFVETACFSPKNGWLATGGRCGGSNLMQRGSQWLGILEKGLRSWRIGDRRAHLLIGGCEVRGGSLALAPTVIKYTKSQVADAVPLCGRRHPGFRSEHAKGYDLLTRNSNAADGWSWQAAQKLWR